MEMYESPLEKIYGEIQSRIIKEDEKNLMYQVNQSVGYKVDKDELVKALQYDRNQYQKGYTDGRNDVFDKIRTDYENRLKADMVAMLTELQLEIKELWDNRYDVWLDNQYYIGKSDTLEEVDDIVQQKINSLKAESEPQESEG